jgi:hypothetical protein
VIAAAAAAAAGAAALGKLLVLRTNEAETGVQLKRWHEAEVELRTC